MARNGTISTQVLDQRELNIRLAEAFVQTAISNVKMMEHEVSAAKAVLTPSSARSDGGNVIVRSPVDGKVLKLLHENEGVVSAGTPLIEIADLADMEIVIDLLSIDAVKVKAGDVAYIEHWGGPDRLLGKVKLVEPSGFTKVSALGIEEQRVNVLIDLVDPREKWMTLGDAFRVEASIVITQKEEVTSIPVAALFRTGGSWSVFKIIDGMAVLTAIEIGLRNDQIAEVESGLKVGDVVITHPSNSISDGTLIAPRS